MRIIFTLCWISLSIEQEKLLRLAVRAVCAIKRSPFSEYAYALDSESPLKMTEMPSGHTLVMRHNRRITIGSSQSPRGIALGLYESS